MYNDLNKKFDIATKKALPYLVLAPPNFRNEIAELMEALFHQLLQRSDSDFDLHYAQINEMIDNRNSFESNLENRVWKFENMFLPMEETIYRMSKQLTELEKRVRLSERETKSLKKSIKITSEMVKTSSVNLLPPEPSSIELLPPEPSSIELLLDESEVDITPNNTSFKEVLQKPDGMYCGFCGAKLTYSGAYYYKSLNTTLDRYICTNAPKCGLCFRVDEQGDSIPMRRTKLILERMEQLKAEQQRTRPEPDAPSAPV